MSELTDKEIEALVRYQDNDFKIINSLLRPGFESESKINSRKGKDYPYMTRDMMNDALNCIGDLYSVILKEYVANGCCSPNQPLFRGTEASLIEAMNNNNSSFISTTTNIFRTLNFSKIFPKDSNGFDDSQRAVLLVNSSVPWINLEEVLGGGEDEIIFVPAKVQISEAKEATNSKFGKQYVMDLTEMDIPPKTPEEIEAMKTTILDKTETMSDYLKYILEVKEKPGFDKNPQVSSIIEEYNNWKSTVVEYNHQQYRLLKEKIINNVDVIETSKKH